MALVHKRDAFGPAATTFNFGVGLLGLGLLVAASIPWASAVGGPGWPFLHATFFLLFVLARLLRFEIPPNITASLVVPLQIASVVLLGAVPTAWLALTAFFAEVMKERALAGQQGRRLRAVLGIIAFNLGMEALTTLTAGLVWHLSVRDGVLEPTAARLGALVLTFVAFKAVNEALMVTGSWLRGVPLFTYLAGARATILIETLTLPLSALLVLIKGRHDYTSFYLFVFTTLLGAFVVRGLTRTRSQLATANAGLQRRVKEIETLAEIGRAISADIETDKLLDTIHKRCADILGANHFFIALYEDGSNRLQIALEMIRGRQDEAKEIPLGEGLTSHVILSRQPLLVRDIDAERGSLPVAPLTVDDRPNRSWLGVPMIARGEVVGAIVLQERQPGAYDEDDVRVLSAIASQAAISVKNARLHREALNALRMEAENRELRRTNAKKSEFVNMVAHQFRTPLTTVIGYAHLLVERVERSGTAPVADLERHLRTVHSESRRLAEMVEELLNLSRIRSGRLPLTFQRFDMEQLIRETLASHQLLAERRGIQLVAAPAVEDDGGDEGQAAVMVTGDSNFVRQVVANMVANAIKYAPESSSVSVTAVRDGAHVRTEVTDVGPGVPADDRERVFDEFFRAAGTTADLPGTGLGLSICRGIVEAHGGRTWCEPRGAGTAFCFTLPVEAPAEGALRPLGSVEDLERTARRSAAGGDRR